MYALQGIASYCGTLNPGGLTLVEYLPLPYVSQEGLSEFISHDSEFLGSLNSVFNAGWLKAHILTTKREWNDQQRNDDQGPYYDRTVEGVIPGHNPGLARELQHMKQYRYLLRVTDRDGQRWLLNTMDHAARFETQYTTGETGPQARSHRIRFTTQVPFQAPIWN